MYTHRQGGERERGGREGGLAPSKFELSFSVKNAKDWTPFLQCSLRCYFAEM